MDRRFRASFHRRGRRGHYTRIVLPTLVRRRWWWWWWRWREMFSFVITDVATRRRRPIDRTLRRCFRPRVVIVSTTMSVRRVFVGRVLVPRSLLWTVRVIRFFLRSSVPSGLDLVDALRRWRWRWWWLSFPSFAAITVVVTFSGRCRRRRRRRRRGSSSILVIRSSGAAIAQSIVAAGRDDERCSPRPAVPGRRSDERRVGDDDDDDDD